MGFRINTNVAALSAHANASMNNRAIDNSLGRLNSGFRINSAADDASGMAIADSLRSQASSLGKAIMNANDAIGIVQTADKAMDEQIKILDTIKEKAIQSAQDGQTTETRKALQADISRLMEELDNIGNTTSFNGQKLLSGTFSNKEFQIGAYSNETVKASIGPTTSDKIGLTRFETGHNVRASDLTSFANFTFKNVDGINDVTFEPVQLVNDSGDIKAGMGLGALAEAINKASDKTGVKASVTVQSVFEQPIKAGSTTAGFSINGVMIGAIDVKEKDGNGALRSAINSVKDQTGVEASVDSKGRLVLANRDGRGIKVEDNVSATKPALDNHALIQNTANGDIKKDVDFNDAKTWTTASGQPGSILNSSNTFADVKMAHGTQDAIIYGDGATKAKEALSAAKAEAAVSPIPKNAVDNFKNDEQGELATLKTAFTAAITAFQGAAVEAVDPAKPTVDEIKAKAVADAAANTLQSVIDKSNDIGEIAKAYSKFLTDAASQTKAFNTMTDANSAIKGALETYAANLVTAGRETITTDLKGVDLTTGEGQVVLDATATLLGGIGTAPANATAAEFNKIANAITTYKTSVANIGKVDNTPKSEAIDLSGLNPTTNGAFNLSTGAANAHVSVKEAQGNALAKLKTDLNASLKTEILDKPAATNQSAAKSTLDDTTRKLISDISNASSVSEVADLLDTFQKSGDLLNSNTSIAGGTVDKVKAEFGKAANTYITSVETAAKEAEKLISQPNSQMGAAVMGQLKELQLSTTAGKTGGQNAVTTAGNEVTNFKQYIASESAYNQATDKILGTGGKVMEAFVELKKQTTVDGANASIDKLNGLLDTIISDAKGKTMDTQEAQNGMMAHAMKQFISGVKAGLNEPNAEGMAGIVGLTVENSTNFGRLSLSSTNGRDIQVEVRDANGYTTNSTVGYDKNVAEKTVSLRETNSTIDRETADAMGFNSEAWQATDAGDNTNGYPAGVMTLKGAQAMMNIAEAAAKALQAVRSDLGSVQNQLVATVNNISVTQVNVKAAESNIRDVDFAQESATFSKHQILAQSGVYAMSQANAVQQNVMRLLQ